MSKFAKVWGWNKLKSIGKYIGYIFKQKFVEI